MPTKPRPAPLTLKALDARLHTMAADICLIEQHIATHGAYHDMSRPEWVDVRTLDARLTALEQARAEGRKAIDEYAARYPQTAWGRLRWIGR